MRFRDRLKAFREAKGWKAPEMVAHLARHDVAVGSAALLHWEHGVRVPDTYAVAKKIAVALGLDADETQALLDEYLVARDEPRAVYPPRRAGTDDGDAAE